MPTSPFQRAADDNLNQPEGSSADGRAGKQEKSKSRPTSSRRNRKQKVKEAYAKAREDAQLMGVIPTSAEGAVRNERVNSLTQGSQALPELVRQALRENWATPDAAKPAIIASLLEPFYNDIVVVDENGKQIRIPPSPKLLIELARTLRQLDQTQFERDNPEAAGKAKGGGNSVSVQTNITAATLVRGMIERGEIGGRASAATMPAPVEPGALGDSRFNGKVETSASPPSDK